MDTRTKEFLACIHEAEKASAATLANLANRDSCKPHPASLAFAAEVVKARKERKLTRKQLAKAADVSLNKVDAMEVGKILPESETARKVCVALGIDVLIDVEE